MVVSDSPIPNAILLRSSNSRSVQRLYPAGGFPQLSTMIFAATSPVTFADTCGVSLRFRFTTHSIPSYTYCLLTRYTTPVVHPHWRAISLCSGTLTGFPSRSVPSCNKSSIQVPSLAVPDGRPCLLYLLSVFLHPLSNTPGTSFPSLLTPLP